MRNLFSLLCIAFFFVVSVWGEPFEVFVTCPDPPVATVGDVVSIRVMLDDYGHPNSSSTITLAYILPESWSFVSSTLGTPVNFDGILSHTGVIESYGRFYAYIYATPNEPGDYNVSFEIAPMGNQLVDLSDNQMCTFNVLGLPELAVTKTCPPTVQYGDIATYVITVANVGSVDAEAFSVLDLLPSAVTYISSAPAGSFESGLVVFNSTGLTSTSVQSFVVSAQVTSFASVVSNAARAEGIREVDLDNNVFECESVYLFPRLFLLPCVEVFDVAHILGEPSAIIVGVANDGSGRASNVVATLELTQGAKFLNATIPPTSQNGNILTWDFGVIESGESAVAVVFVDVVRTPDNRMVYELSVTTSTPQSPDETNPQTYSCDEPILFADLAVEKICPTEPAVVGQNITYTINVNNLGNATANEVVLTDVLPEGVTFVSAVPEPDSSSTASVLVWTGLVAPDQPVTLYVTVLVNAEGTLTNKVNITSSSLEGGQRDCNNEDECSVVATC